MNEENPNAANRDYVSYGLHGGQPPGSEVDLGGVKILERPASRSDLETGRAPKKGMSDFGLTTGMEVEESETDELVSEVAKSTSLNGEDSVGKTVSYAAMLAKHGAEEGGAKQTLNFTDEDVVVLDEDCLVDESGAFSTIKFSDLVLDQIDKSAMSGPRFEADGSLSKRYGPWIVAANRRRQYSIPNTVAMDVATGHKSGSRFAALATGEAGEGSEQTMEAGRDVRDVPELSGPRVEVAADAREKQVVQGTSRKFNKAYMVSNPKRPSKGDKEALNGSRTVEVVSLMEGVTVEGIAREVSAKMGSHVVTVTDGTHVTKGLNRAGEGSSKQQVRLNRGLRIKQPLGVRSLSRVPISNWTPGVVSMIDDEAQRMQHGLDRDYEVMDDDDPDGGDFETPMKDRSILIRDEVVEVVDEEVVPR
ncbi:hypothetical protein V6N13_075900 [Hibiscus sabdariffa]|uniref:Uncharacterized protein n=1 Tax=Hibiscus sabdariffa TaxID=183260 RepID=A0ABR2UDH2_9ROSI